jgi:vitamin K-dependent gamma-carboxylase
VGRVKEFQPAKPWQQFLFAPVDIASMAVLRIGFGAILFWEVWRNFENGWIRSHYITRNIHFKHFGFE